MKCGDSDYNAQGSRLIIGSPTIPLVPWPIHILIVLFSKMLKFLKIIFFQNKKIL
jgi:hypothetical protein